MKWNELKESHKIPYFILIFLIGFLLRMADPISIIFCAYYIIISHTLYKKDEQGKSLGLQQSSRNGYIVAIITPFILIAIFLPFYILSPLCPMHLFDDLLTMVYRLVGENLWLMIFLFWIIIGTFSVYAEEILFRGFMQDAVEDILARDNIEEKKFSKKRLEALTICSLLFGVSHLNLLWADIFYWVSVEPDILFIIIGILCLSGIGFLFGILRIKYDSLYPALLAHTIGNFFMILIPSLILFG